MYLDVPMSIKWGYFRIWKHLEFVIILKLHYCSIMFKKNNDL